MSEISDRHSISGPIWRAVRVALAALLGSAILLIGLTRTQVGRDGIRNQLESSFNQRYEGSLTIGTLSGSVINDLIATDVRLKSPSGEVVATVDSIIAIPRWANLLTSELSIRSLDIIRPRLAPSRDSTGVWNAERTFERVNPEQTSGSPLDLTLARISVDDGHLVTTRAGSPPPSVDNQWIFDFTRTEVTNVSLRASVERSGSSTFLDVQEGSFTVPEPNVRVSTLEGQFHRHRDGWSLRQLDASLDTTRIRGEATIRTAQSKRNPSSFTVRLDRSRLDHDEVKRLVPRLPLEDLVTVQGEIEGRANRLVLNDLEVTHSASFATFRGTVNDAGPISHLDLEIPESRFTLGDVREVWPGLPKLPDSLIGPVHVTGSIEGTTTRSTLPDRFDLQGSLQAQSQHGAVQGSMAVANAPGDTLRYSGSVTVDTLNIDPFTRATSLATELTGRIDVDGTGPLMAPHNGTLDFSLSPSQIGSRRFASAQGNISTDEGSVKGRLQFLQPDGGTLKVEGTLDTLDVESNYHAVASASEFDLARNRDLFPSTRLNARVTLRGSGMQWERLTGTAVLNVDSSAVLRGDSAAVLPPHSATLRLSDRQSNRPRVQLTGSIARVTIDGTSLGPRLWSSARTWGRAMQYAVSRELDKPMPSRDSALTRTLLPAGADSTLTSSVGEPNEFSPTSDTSDPIDASAQVQVHRSDILHAWWPALPKHSSELDVDASLTISQDSIDASGLISAGRLAYGADSVTDFSVEYEISGHRQAPLAQSLRARVNLSAAAIHTAGLPISGASASLSYEARAGTLQVRADSAGITGPIELTSDLRITPAENEFRIRSASIGLRGTKWKNISPASVVAYSNGVVITPFLLNRPHPQTTETQEIRVGGTLSSSAADTLSVETQNVALVPFSQALVTPNLIGGDLSGSVHITNGDDLPEMAGSFSVRRLSYDRRVLGDANVDVNYSAQAPDLRIGGSLKSTTTSIDSLVGPQLVPSGPKSVEPNSLSLTGRIRLPQWAVSRTSAGPSQIATGETFDLNVDVERADLFFFRYIFEEHIGSIQGHTTGSVHIGGDYKNPVFDADLSFDKAAVTLPQFGLNYEFNGPVTVDKEGIHLRKMSVRDDGGSATVSGSIFFNKYRYFSFDLSATLDGLTVIDVSRAEDLPFYGHIRASGPVTLSGPLPDATLRSNSARTTEDSELFIPVSGETVENEAGFIVFRDSTGKVPDLQNITRRENILADRPEGQPTFVEGLNIDLNLTAPEGSTVNLVFDPVVGDVVTAVGSGRVQLQRQEGDFRVFGNFNATSGSYLFTAGEVFVRQFSLSEGTITWDGDPINAQLDLAAEYRTRASPSGLPGYENYRGRIPVTVKLNITGRVATPRVDLNLALTRQERGNLVGSETLDAILNEPALRTEYATSVLLTNTFLLTTESIMQGGATQPGATNNRLTAAGNQLAFNSVSQLVSSQLNRYLGAALPNVDLNFGVQGERPNNLDLIYGVALRLLNERLVIRGEGVYTGDEPDAAQARGPQGEFVVEVRLNPNISAKVFYRRTGDELTRNQALTSSRGAGLSFQTVFSTWKEFFGRLFGWILPTDGAPPNEETDSDSVAQNPEPTTDSTGTANRPHLYP